MFNYEKRIKKIEEEIFPIPKKEESYSPFSELWILDDYKNRSLLQRIEDIEKRIITDTDKTDLLLDYFGIKYFESSKKGFKKIVKIKKHK
jgi:hypothetical protein